MDTLDWSNRHHELEQSLGEAILEDAFDPIQQIQTNDDLFPNIMSQWDATSSEAGILHSSTSEVNMPNYKILNVPQNCPTFDSLDERIFSDCTSLWNFTQTTTPKSVQLLSNTNATKFVTTTSQNSSEPNNASKRNREELAHSSKNSTSPNLMSQNQPTPKKPRLEKRPVSSSSNINFQQSAAASSSSTDEPDTEAIAHMKEMIYRAAAFRPVSFGSTAETHVDKPKRKNVRISRDPQTVAARQRRERISERIRVLQDLVPGGTKMDTASMLDEAANYLKFLRSQIKALEAFGNNHFSNYNVNLSFSPFFNYPAFTMQQPQFWIHPKS